MYSILAHKKVILALVTVSLLLMFGSSGCGVSSQSLGKDVLALVDGDPITVKDFTKSYRGGMSDKMDEMTKMLDQLILRKIAAKEALAAGMLADPKVNSDMQEFYAKLLPDFLRKRIYDDTVVTDEDLKPLKEGLTPLLDVSMLVASNEDAARSALEKLKAGANFKDVMMEYSIIKTTPDRIISLKDELYPAGVRAVLNGLKPGSFSPVMKVDIGYGVFKLNSRRDPDEIWKAKAEQERLRIRQEKTDRQIAEMTDSLRAAADIKYTMSKGPDGGTVVSGVVVDGVSIDIKDAAFEKQAGPHAPHAGMNQNTMRSALKNIVDGFLLSQEAKRRGIQYDPEFVEVQKRVREEILAEAYMNKVRGEDNITDAEVLDYFNKNKERFKKSPDVRLSRMLFRTEQEADATLAELKAGKDFGQLAKERSVDKETAKVGGDVGFLPVYKMENLKEPLKSALGKLKPGEFTGVLKSDYGFEIVKETEVKKNDELNLASEGAESLRRRVKLVRQSERIEKFYLDEMKKVKVQKNLDLLKTLLKKENAH